MSVCSVRDKFAKLIQKFKSNENKEARASGIQGQEYDEVYKGLTDICQRMKEATSMWEKKTEKEKKEGRWRKGQGRKYEKKATGTQGKPKKVKKMMRKQQHLKKEEEVKQQNA